MSARTSASELADKAVRPPGSGRFVVPGERRGPGQPLLVHAAPEDPGGRNAIISPMNDPSTILIVDDHAGNRETLAALLECPDYTLIEAVDGPQALIRAGEYRPDLILLDVMMPGLDGFEVCRRLRADATLAEVPVIMLTALDDQRSRMEGIEAGADDFLTKPFHGPELRARVRTITRLNRYRLLLQAQERVWEQARWLDEASDAIFYRNLEDRITYWNRAAAQLFGWAHEEKAERTACEMLPNDSTPPHQAARRSAGEAGNWWGELSHVTKSGREIIVACRLTLMRDLQNKPKGLLCVHSDITEHKRAETGLLRKQRLESIGTLVSGVAHDLNNSLAPVLMGVDILRLQGVEDLELLADMETSARYGSEMVKQLLTYAKGAEGEKIRLKTEKLLQEVARLIRGSFPKNIELITRIADSMPDVLGNQTHLHQVLLNLCVNARDAMPEGGTLTLEGRDTEITALECAAFPDAKPGHYVWWRVSDTGTGIPESVRERIFDPFFSTKTPMKGTGLGLSTVLGILRGHAGFVRVTSEPGQGSAFDIYLPAMAPIDRPEAPPSTPAPRLDEAVPVPPEG